MTSSNMLSVTGTRAQKNRARKLQREVGADALVCDKIFEAGISVRGRVVVKLDALVDALLDCVMHSGLEMGLGQTLTKFKIPLIEELVPWDRHPIDVPEPTIDAHTHTVLGIVQPGRCDSARRSCGNGACSSLQAPLMYMTAWPATPPSPFRLERNWLVAQSST